MILFTIKYDFQSIFSWDMLWDFTGRFDNLENDRDDIIEPLIQGFTKKYGFEK